MIKKLRTGLCCIIQGTYPIKYKGFHVLYDSFIFDPLLKVFKMFAPRKIRERVSQFLKNIYKTKPPK